MWGRVRRTCAPESVAVANAQETGVDSGYPFDDIGQPVGNVPAAC